MPSLSCKCIQKDPWFCSRNSPLSLGNYYANSATLPVPNLLRLSFHVRQRLEIDDKPGSTQWAHLPLLVQQRRQQHHRKIPLPPLPCLQQHYPLSIRIAHGPGAAQIGRKPWYPPPAPIHKQQPSRGITPIHKLSPQAQELVRRRNDSIYSP